MYRYSGNSLRFGGEQLRIMNGEIRLEEEIHWIRLDSIVNFVLSFVLILQDVFSFYT